MHQSHRKENEAFPHHDLPVNHRTPLQEGSSE